MNMHRLSIRLIISLCLVQVFSCQKQLEKPAEDSLNFETSSDAAIANEYINCKLRTFITEVPGVSDWYATYTFVYHADGLPGKLTNDGPGGNNYYFFYDTKRRLRELRVGGTPDFQAEEKWHKYGYNNADQIIVDTIYNMHVAGDTSISEFSYDNQGRIVTETNRQIRGGTPHVITYEYDARGNLVVEGWPASSYDYNVSIFRNHPLFQFIHRNYSQNNAAPQAKYNAKGLPLSNNPSNDTFFDAYPTSISGGKGIIRATYDCDGFTPPNEFLYCKLRTVSHEFINPPGTPNLEIKGTFVYHPDGLPGSLTYNNSGTGNPNYYFVYDSKRRLKELQIAYRRNEGGDGGPWHRYGYNNADQIVVDTLLNFASFDPASAFVRFISKLTYDAQGRVRSEVSTEYSGGVPGASQTLTYDYDSRGNLIVAGWPSSSYDNKVSIFRAHSLFQFIHRNYSKNNAAVQPRYNSKGLPLSNKPMNDAFFNAYPSTVRGTDIVKVNYDCP